MKQMQLIGDINAVLTTREFAKMCHEFNQYLIGHCPMAISPESARGQENAKR
jgi:hypothetical protein